MEERRSKSIGSLFSGIGGLELGLEWAGLGPVLWQVEIDPFCREVLAEHWPGVRRYEDVTRLSAPAPVDLICGGFPCQDVSSAGKGAGLAGERSGLWFEFARIVGEVRPEWVVVENVASGARRWVNDVVAGLGQLGYQALAVPLSAQDVGAPHIRRRIFIVAHAIGGGRQTRGLSEREAAPVSAPCLGYSHAPNAAGEHSRERAWVTEDWRQERRDPKGCITRHPNCEREPAELVDVEVAGLQGLASDPSSWATAPEFRRVGDGAPNRVDRLRALGNAVVPQCAEVIGWVIRELMDAGGS